MSLNHPKKRVFINKGFKAFESKDYKLAMQYFAEALRMDNQDLEAKIGLLLSDMVNEFPQEAQGFYDLYRTMLINNPRSFRKKVQEGLLDSLKTFDKGIEKISAVLYDENDLKIDQLNGILYSDFKQMCQNSNFKEVFENLIFSTKIIFTKKEDFYDFLESLLENGFVDFCLQYIENMKDTMLYDPKISAILKRAVQNL